MRALGLQAVPSSPTLRQRLDTQASDWFELSGQLNQALLGSRIEGRAIDFGALGCGYTPVDLDTFAMDNSDTQKELVGRTYAGVDGYCPLAVYLGRLGYCLELALRPGVQHSACESEYNLERALPLAASLVTGPLLVRADAGFCSVKLMQEISAQSVALGREMAPQSSSGTRARPRLRRWPQARWAILRAQPGKRCARASANASGRTGSIWSKSAAKRIRPGAFTA